MRPQASYPAPATIARPRPNLIVTPAPSPPEQAADDAVETARLVRTAAGGTRKHGSRSSTATATCCAQSRERTG